MTSNDAQSLDVRALRVVMAVAVSGSFTAAVRTSGRAGALVGSCPTINGRKDLQRQSSVTATLTIPRPRQRLDDTYVKTYYLGILGDPPCPQP